MALQPKMFLLSALLLGQNLCAQKFSTNTELQLLNKYPNEFHLTYSSQKERNNTINFCLQELRKYPKKMALRIRDNKDTKGSDIQTVIDVKLTTLFLTKCESAQLISCSRPSPKTVKSIYKDSLVNYLRYEGVFSINALEVLSSNIKDIDSAICFNNLLINYYYHDGLLPYRHNSSEKAIYYMYKGIQLCEKQNEPTGLIKLRKLLHDIAQDQWNAYNNFYTYEKILALYLKSFEVSRIIKNRKLIMEDKVFILLAISQMRNASNGQMTLSQPDLKLLDNVYLSLLEEILLYSNRSTNIDIVYPHMRIFLMQ